MLENKLQLPYKRRLTKQRQIILDFLKNDHSHPTAEQAYQKLRKLMPKLSLGTVYRNLKFLSNVGLIKEIHSPEQISRFDGQQKDHDHFFCYVCKKLCNIPKYPLQTKHLKKYGNYICGDFRLDYSGICYKCHNKQPCLKIKN